MSRRLDAAVALRVLGWRWYSSFGKAFLLPPVAHSYADGFRVLWTRGFRETTLGGDIRKTVRSYEIERHCPDYKHWALPKFSEDIGAAFRIVRAMRPALLLLDAESDGWLAAFSRSGWPLGRSKAATAPLAICRAALVALRNPDWNRKLPGEK